MTDPVRPLTPGEVINPGSEAHLVSEAERIRQQEDLGRGQAIATVGQAFQRSQGELSKLIDPDLLFSQASDAVGSRAKRSLSSLRRSLGARGLSPNSGAAQGALSRLAFGQQQALTGARRDIALENQRQRQVNAATQFANAVNYANVLQSPVSGIGFEAAQTLFEGQIAREGLAAQARSTRSANQTSLLGSVIGGGLGVLAGLI